MTRTLVQWAITVGIGACLLAETIRLTGQTAARNAEWRTYGADLANTHYSALDQISRDNFNRLQVAWRFKTDSLGPRPETNLQSTPLMVGGVLYSTAGSRRDVVALDAGTGELMWMHSEREGPRGDNAPRNLSGRGLAYWSDSTGRGTRRRSRCSCSGSSPRYRSRCCLYFSSCSISRGDGTGPRSP